MDFFNELKRRAAGHPPTRYPNRPEPNALKDALDAGQRLKRAENYAAAIEALTSAMQLAVSSGDASSMAIVALNQAEIYGYLHRYDEATALLERTFQTAQETRQRIQMAYILIGQGTLAQKQDDWKLAQTKYDSAVEMARTVRSSGAEGRALGYLAEVYLHENNASYAVRLLREALPKLNQASDLELSSLFVGRLGQALIISGQEVEGQQLLERALRLAKQTGYKRYERQWSVALAERALNNGQSQEAFQYLEESLALFDIKDQAGDYINALTLIVKTCLNLQQYDDALEYAKRAANVASDIPQDERAALQADTLMGITLTAKKDYAKAITHLNRAAHVITQNNVQPVTFTETDVVRNLAAAHVELGEEESAVMAYRKAIARAEQNDNQIEAAQASRDLGLFFASRQKMSDAIREWSSALTIYEAERQTSQVARLYCDLAAARKFIGQGQRALKDYEEALMLLSNLKEDWETRGLVLANAATAYADQGDMDSADSFFNEAIAIARRMNNETAEATRRGNYGWFLLATGRHEQALSMLEYALRLSKNLGLNLQAAIQTDNLGLAYDNLGNYEKGLTYHQEAAALVEPLNKPHWQHVINLSRAASLNGLHRADEAQVIYEVVLEQGRANNDVELTIRALTGLSQISLELEKPADCGVWLEEAVTLARKADMRRLQAEALAVYSQQQAALGNPEQAGSLWYDAQKLFTILRAPQATIKPAWLNMNN
ncbi:MAG: tetratricopeptide repeat protein [Anaerolineaceae bacterium]|nr:tetratricopeptide repeat protein [Anaerolineaceae bacterium]